MSPTTEEYDRGDKLTNYKAIPSLREVLLIAQEKHQVECHRRGDDGNWGWTEVRSGAVELAALGGVVLRLGDIYEDVRPPSTSPQ